MNRKRLDTLAALFYGIAAAIVSFLSFLLSYTIFAEHPVRTLFYVLGAIMTLILMTAGSVCENYKKLPPRTNGYAQKETK